jgi:glycosyltransferase involved in cell wall biosynthesis
MSISVLMSVYIHDVPSYFFTALESIINQSFKPNEIVIVFDGPVHSDIENYIDDKITNGINIVKVKLENNSGLGLALKKGLEFCSNEFIARMDSDDISRQDRLLVQSKIFDNDAKLAIVGSLMYEFSDSPTNLKYIRRLPIESNEIKNFSRYRNPLNHPTVMFKKSVILNAGSYENIISFEDYFLWLKVLKLGYTIKNIPEPLLYFRMNNFVNRRIGFKYFLNELKFYKKVHQRKLLSNIYIFILILIKFPIRLFPLSFTQKIYFNLLRKKV